MRALASTVSPPPYVPPPSARLRVRVWVIALLRTPAYSLCVVAVLLANLGVMLAKSTTTPPSVLMERDIVFVCFYAFDLLLRLLALRPTAFIQSVYNVVDSLATVGSVVGLVAYSITPAPTALTVLRICRLARLFRLVDLFSFTRVLVRAARVVVSDLLGIFFFVLVVFLVFGVLGGAAFSTVRDGTAINPQANFRTFSGAALVLMQAITLDNWNAIMYDLMRTAPKCSNNAVLADCGSVPVAALFFISFYLVGASILLSLVVGILYDGFFLASSTKRRGPVSLAQLESAATLWTAHFGTSSAVPRREVLSYLRELSSRDPILCPPEMWRSRLKYIVFQAMLDYGVWLRHSAKAHSLVWVGPLHVGMVREEPADFDPVFISKVDRWPPPQVEQAYFSDVVTSLLHRAHGYHPDDILPPSERSRCLPRALRLGATALLQAAFRSSLTVRSLQRTNPALAERLAAVRQALCRHANGEREPAAAPHPHSFRLPPGSSSNAPSAPPPNPLVPALPLPGVSPKLFVPAPRPADAADPPADQPRPPPRKPTPEPPPRPSTVAGVGAKRLATAPAKPAEAADFPPPLPAPPTVVGRAAAEGGGVVGVRFSTNAPPPLAELRGELSGLPPTSPLPAPPPRQPAPPAWAAEGGSPPMFSAIPTRPEGERRRHPRLAVLELEEGAGRQAVVALQHQEFVDVLLPMHRSLVLSQLAGMLSRSIDRSSLA